MNQKIENYFFKLIRNEKKGFLASLLRAFLLLLSWVFKLIVSCRNWVFDRKLLSQYYAPVPVVISIGNIVAGGAGKTPVTQMLAQEFYNNFTIAILSRGYRSQAENLSAPVVLSKGEGPMLPASYCGDEPFLLSKNLPKALVFVGKDRHKSSDMAAKAGAQLILLDDGMQHRRMARDFEVVVMDCHDPFGLGYFLPRGLLRDNIKSLVRANLIVLNHVQNSEQFSSIKQQISFYTKASVIGTRIGHPEIFGNHHQKIETIKMKKVGIFCAIAHPEYFQKTVEDLGAEVVDSYFIQDHKSFDSESLEEFAQKCFEKETEYLICTEKDWVKIDPSLYEHLPIVWVKIRFLLVEGESYWKDFIKQVNTDLKRRI